MEKENENMENRVAVFNTTKGTFRIELFEDKAPVTTENFIKLVTKGFYDGLIFHRVIPQFMIQGGCPKGNGTGGPGYTIKDEFHKDLSNVRGTIAMANRGPNTGGSQWFINVIDNCYLDFDKKPYSSAHPVFGKVIEGMDVVDLISNAKADANDKPVQEIRINKVTISG
jgi:cyclophilin family peptidyl-prolyl cis-trans isomerase